MLTSVLINKTTTCNQARRQNAERNFEHNTSPALDAFFCVFLRHRSARMRSLSRVRFQVCFSLLSLSLRFLCTTTQLRSARLRAFFCACLRFLVISHHGRACIASAFSCVRFVRLFSSPTTQSMICVFCVCLSHRGARMCFSYSLRFKAFSLSTPCPHICLRLSACVFLLAFSGLLVGAAQKIE